jgi:hypothetical protein
MLQRLYYCGQGMVDWLSSGPEERLGERNMSPRQPILVSALLKGGLPRRKESTTDNLESKNRATAGFRGRPVKTVYPKRHQEQESR